METTSLINIEWYIDSVRYLWLTTLDSIKELIDNSIDANAKNIYINIFDSNDEIQITLEDDWDWIAEKMIEKVLSFWWRSNMWINTVGKFWWWLPSASCCQTVRTELFSKVKNWEFHFSYIDLDELKNNNAILPKPTIKKPKFNLECIDSNWTFIHLKDCDDTDYKTISKLSEKVAEDIWRTYRYFMNNWLNIYLNGIKVKIIDPLFQMKGSKDYNTFWESQVLEDIEPIIIKDVIDPITKKPAEINITIILMNFDIIKNIPWYRSEVKWVFNIPQQWFSLIRNGREIWTGLSLWIFTKHNNFNYFRWEILFPDCLDKFFWVHTNKSRFTVKAEIKDQIKEKTLRIISEIRRATISFQKANMSNDDWTQVKRSESIINKIDWEFKKNQTTLKTEMSDEEIKNQEREIRNVNEDKSLSPKQKIEKIEKIKKAFSLPWRFTKEARWSGDFFEWIYKWKQSIISINTDHPFYEKMYLELEKQNAESHLELLVYALAKGQQESLWYKKREEFYTDEKNLWSKILRKTFNEYNDYDYDS